MRLVICFLFGFAVLGGVVLWSIAGALSPAPERAGAVENKETTDHLHANGASVLQEDDPGDSPSSPAGLDAGDDGEPRSRTVPALRAPVDSASVRWASTPNFDGATASAWAHLSRDPYHETALRDALLAAEAERDWATAAEYAGRLCELSPNDRGLQFAHAGLLLRQSRFADAISTLRRLSEETPNDARIWHNLAIAHQGCGHLRDACSAWNRVVDLDPENIEALAQRGEILLRLGEARAAALDLECALALAPAEIGIAWNLASAYEQSGRIETAVDLLEKHIADRPNHVQLLNRLAALKSRISMTDDATQNENRAEAIRLWQRSLRLNPQQPDVRAALAAAQHDPMSKPDRP